MAEVINMIQSKTGLEANGKNEEIILAYVEQNASDALIAKIKESKKTMSQCMAYIRGEAKGKAKNGVAMIEDKEVFGWAIHFFEEDSIKGDGANKVIKPAKPVEIKSAPKVEVKEPKKDEKKPDKQLDGQIDIFQLMGGMT